MTRPKTITPTSALVTAAVQRLTTCTAYVEPDAAQPVSAALDVSVENNPVTAEPCVVVTIWGDNAGHAAFIRHCDLRGLLAALLSAAHEISGAPAGPVQ